MSCEEGLYRNLRQRGMRVTPQREIVLSVLHDIADHATVEEIHRRVLERSSDQHLHCLSYAGDAAGDGDVGHLGRRRRPRRYTLCHEHHGHAHMLCSRCGAVIDAAPAAVESLAASLQEQHGFVLAGAS